MARNHDEKYGRMVACIFAGKRLSQKESDAFEEYRKEFGNSGDQHKQNLIRLGEMLKQ